MEKIGFLLCEGDSDVPFLSKIVPIGYQIRIIPTGGKYGAGSFIKGFLEGRKVSKPDFHFYYRDRDFDFPPPEPQPQITQKTGGLLISHRITLENYLLSPEVFYHFLQEKSKTAQFNLMSIEDVESLFDQAANEIKHYQAARHALGSIRVPIGFKTTWVEAGSGTLPIDLTNEFCRDSAINLIEPEQHKLLNITADIFDSQYTAFIKHFDTDFILVKGYLTWFQGKDLAASIKRRLPDFPMNAFFKFALQKFDYSTFPDLVQLQNLLLVELNK